MNTKRNLSARGGGISIIVPVYNAAISINKCLDSILSQTYPDFELILVDDGSKDNSYEICRNYAEKDARIHILRQENGGCSSARNLGIAQANRQWLAFIDADDWVEPKYLEELIGEAEHHEVDLVMQSFTRKDEQGHVIFKTINEQTLIRKNEFSKLFNTYDIQAPPWAKIFKTEIVHNAGIRFNTRMHYGEDLVFTYDYVRYIKSFYISSTNNYNYIDSINTLSRRFFTFEKEYACYTEYMEAYERTSAVLNVFIPPATGLRLFDRCLHTLYLNKYPRSERLRCLRSLDIDFYRRNIQPSSLTHKILIFLLTNRLYVAYDCIRSLKY